MVQIEHDFPIWENIRYLKNAGLTRNEGKPTVAIRRSADRFYGATNGGAL
jgi:hypothetical protein